jgi:hypothetical protein
VRYYSGDGKKKKGCNPVVKMRKALCSLVLVDEEDVGFEDVVTSHLVEQGQQPLQSLLAPGMDQVGSDGDAFVASLVSSLDSQDGGDRGDVDVDVDAAADGDDGDRSKRNRPGEEYMLK